MSSNATADKRARSLGELSGHERAVATELAEWGYRFTGHDGKGAVIMTHPRAGVVRIHHTPKSKSGARISILKLAAQQLRHIGIQVDLPWRPTSPKKEAIPVTTVAEDKVKLDARGVGERIIALAAEGKLGDTFTSAEVYDYLNGKYVLPRYSGDPAGSAGSVIVSQKLLALEKQGILRRKKVDTGNGVMRYQYSYNMPLPSGEAQVGEAEPVAPPPQVEDVPLAPAAEPVDVAAGVEVAPAGEAAPPAPEVEPDEPEPEPAPPAQAPPAALPAEALEALRGYFIGDLEVENELLREALTSIVAVLTAAAEEAQAALAAVGERLANPQRRATKRPSRGEGQIGPHREARLQRIVETAPHGESLHINTYAEHSGLGTSETGNALNAAVRLGWRSVDGHTIVQDRRGYYTIHDPSC